jgi:hypothetical protein
MIEQFLFTGHTQRYTDNEEWFHGDVLCLERVNVYERLTVYL